MGAECDAVACRQLLRVCVCTIGSTTTPSEGIPNVHWVVPARAEETARRRVAGGHGRQPGHVINRLALLYFQGRPETVMLWQVPLLLELRGIGRCGPGLKQADGIVVRARQETEAVWRPLGVLEEIVGEAVGREVLDSRTQRTENARCRRKLAPGTHSCRRLLSRVIHRGRRPRGGMWRMLTSHSETRDNFTCGAAAD